MIYAMGAEVRSLILNCRVWSSPAAALSPAFSDSLLEFLGTGKWEYLFRKCGKKVALVHQDGLLTVGLITTFRPFLQVVCSFCSGYGWTSNCSFAPAIGLGAMAIYVREANLTNDQGILIELARAYLNGDSDESRFRWLYQENPFGPARAWLACENRDEVIGMAAVFPRRMYRGGVVVTGCVLGDLCISTKYRSVGPALQLQRTCLTCARSEEFAVAYDFPSTTMTRVYEHLRILPMGKSVRLVKTLRIDNKIKRIFPVPLLSRPLAAAGNFALAVSDHKPPD